MERRDRVGALKDQRRAAEAGEARVRARIVVPAKDIHVPERDGGAVGDGDLEPIGERAREYESVSGDRVAVVVLYLGKVAIPTAGGIKQTGAGSGASTERAGRIAAITLFELAKFLRRPDQLAKLVIVNFKFIMAECSPLVILETRAVAIFGRLP